MNPHELVGAYALHALDEHEALAFEAHLAACTECQEELASFDVVLDELAEPGVAEPGPVDQAIVDEAVSPDRRARLGDAVASAVASTAQEPAREASPAAARMRADRAGGGSDARHGARPGGRPRHLLMAAAAAVVAVLAVGVGFIIGTGDEPSQIAQDVERIQSAEDVVESPLGLGEATAFVSVTEGVAVVGDTPALESGETYQLWVVPADGSAPLPGPTMAGGDVTAVWEADLEGAGAIAVSIEPAGGSTTPTEVVTAVEL
ncbi:anti-sigma factor domain-containing protein [Demequina sp. NBRC 110053]|uniref:anti-sigma factor n=1 Tax=Demequina sp. NBRC 110053 TaxID=1570342 RepID=UPI000A05E125|nr:anti-sigma factor [Demequina sp. NBRC 110053]